MEPIIALDLETTGLDPERDTIIEIGLVHFSGARIEHTWQQLINPGRPLPAFITQLTGINDTMLSKAPRLNSVLDELKDFVGDLPILGHNINFDLSFLRRKGLFQFNQRIDTFDLASVLIPAAGRYRLDALASALGVIPQQRHRALEDARTTHQVYLRLCEKVRLLPRPLVEEIVRLGENIEWGAGWTFEEILDEFGGTPDKFTPIQLLPDLKPSPRRTLIPREEHLPLDIDELAAILEPRGPFATQFPAYEYRSQQVSMLRAIAGALSYSGHLLVEAGTGIGKSLAYLIPAFAWAAQNGERVIISTNTINLQDQLRYHDIPAINDILGSSYQASILKGRRNYLCPRLLDALRHLGPRTAEEMRVLAKIFVWLIEGGSGDRNEITLTGTEESAVWARLSAESEDCSPETCAHFADNRCPYYDARGAAESAHVVIINHALLLADITTGNRVIPEYKYLIIDEAHHLESATTNGLSFTVSEATLKRLLNDLGAKTPGLLQGVQLFSQSVMDPSKLTQWSRKIKSALQSARECDTLISAFFQSLDTFLARQREDEPIGIYGQRTRIQPSTRTLPIWDEVEAAWDLARQPMNAVIHSSLEINESLLAFASEGEGRGEDLVVALRSIGNGLTEIYRQIDQMIFEPDPKMVYWLEIAGPYERLTLHAAPLEIGHLVERYLWNEKESVVLTSATLTTAGEFNYIRQRLNAKDADELLLGSPFDFEASTLLYLVNDIPEPQEREAYQHAVERGLIGLCTATRGKALVLFTSYEQLQRTAKAITEPLAKHEIFVFEQGEGASRHALLETFRGTDQAVLLGTRSFWEGVDVPGPALSVLVIIRLPFDVPNDPIVAARAETYESPFDQFTVPEAILRFRQGFGRLIRTKSDRGIVALFDRRLLTKRYGRLFLESLPQCTLRVEPLATLPGAAARWIGE
jgi:ATP-dependent DNA helicase DinG